MTGNDSQQPYGAPAQQKASPWVWVALATSIGSVLLVIAGGLLVAGFAFFRGGFGEFGDHGMPYGPMDEPGMPSRAVIRAIEEPCETMIDAAEKITPYAPIPQAKRELRAWADAADEIAQAIDGAKPEGHNKDWRDDWKDTSAAVRSYADGLGTSEERVDLPSGLDGMYFPLPPNCMVPMVIKALDPDHATGPEYY